MRAQRMVFWVALLLVLPAAAWAQGGYQTYSHVESGFLYWGLGAQAILRASSLRHVPYAIITFCTIWLLYRRTYAAMPQPLSSVVVYLIHCALVLVLFWPEAIYRFFGGVTAIPGLVVTAHEGSVFSYVARTSGAANDDASTMRLAGVNLTPGGAPVPRALDLLLRMATETPRRLGERINAEMDRPLSHLGAMEALLTQPMTSDASRYALTEYTDQCYKDAVADMTNDATITSETTWQERLPWSPEMAPYMARQVRLGPVGGVSDALLGLAGVVSCNQIYIALERAVLRDLAGERTGGGSNMQSIYLNELGIPQLDSARFVISQELSKEMGKFVEPPNLTAGYAAATVTKGAVKGAAQGKGWLGSLWGALTGAATEGVEQAATGAVNFMRPALFLIWWMPYITGLLSAVVLTFFPFVILWALFPGQHIRPLMNYMLMLFFVHSTPLWWAIADAASSMAAGIGTPHAAGAIFQSVGELFRGMGAGVVVGVLAILLVPAIQAVMLFGTWRAIGSIWRG